MENEDKAFKRYKRKAWWWDQFWHPLASLFNIKHIKTLLIIISIFDMIVFFNKIYTYAIPGGILLLLIIYDDIYKYYKSGEYIQNYKKHKYMKYPEYQQYKKAIKQVRSERKEQSNFPVIKHEEPKEDLIDDIGMEVDYEDNKYSDLNKGEVSNDKDIGKENQ